MQSDHFEEFFAPELEKHGYAAVYKKKTAEVHLTPLLAQKSCRCISLFPGFGVVGFPETGMSVLFWRALVLTRYVSFAVL